MNKDLRKLAEKYDSLEGLAISTLEGMILGKITAEWFSSRPEAANSLVESKWFHLDNLDLEVGNDGRLKLTEGVITEVPMNESKEKLRYARDFLADYFSLVKKYLLDPSKLEQTLSSGEGTEEWGDEDFLLGLIKRGRDADF